MKTFYFLGACVLIMNCSGQSNKNLDNDPTSPNYKGIFTMLNKALLAQQEPNVEVEEILDADYGGIIVQTKDEFPITSTYNYSKKREDLVMGDLNSDGVDDIIVAVESNFGGNSSFINYYYFQSENGQYKLVNPTSWEIESYCKDEPYGAFFIEEISDGKIIGESRCLKETDPRCCPSVIYTTTFEPEGTKLKWISTSFKENRAIEYYQQ